MLADQGTRSCWFLSGAPIIHVLLGPSGDLIQLCPAWLELYRRTGRKPFVIVSHDYANVLNGVSYVDVFPFSGHWSRDVPKARAYALSRWCDARVLNWWNDDQPVSSEFRGATSLNCRGRTCRINTRLWSSYGHSMMERAGFPREEDWLHLPLVFDRRDPQRESALLARVWPSALRRRPLLLYNFTGHSSPFGHLDIVWPLLQSVARDFHLVDLGKVRAERIYDLVGLYEAADGLLTSDTATLHLAPASQVPYIAFTQDGWSGSVPRGNCVLRVAYSHTPRRLQEIRAVLEGWARDRRSSHSLLVPQTV